MQRRGLFQFVFTFTLLLCAFQATRVAAAEPAALRYQLKDGQTYVYDVHIQVDLPDTQQTITGLSKYQVKSVDAATGQITLTHSADLASAWRSTGQGLGAGRRAMHAAMGSPFSFANYNAPCEIVINPNGNIVRYERKSQLPYLLGNAWALTIQPLPANGQKTWQAKRDIEIIEQDTNGWFPHPMANKTVNHSATETIDFAITDPTAAAPSIARTYAMTSAEQSDGEPVFSQKGQGTLTFDPKAGAIQSVDEKYTLRVNDPGVTLKIPITITAKLLTAAEAEKVVTDRKAATQKAQLALEDSQKLKPMDSDELDQTLAAIKSTNSFDHHRGLDKLAQAVPIETRRDEVATFLVGLLGDRDNWTVTSAEKALKVWGNDASTPALIKLLDDRDTFIRGGAMDALAPRKNEAAAEAVAKQLTDFGSQQKASKALKEMGPVAEKPVLPLLKDKDWNVRMVACEILAAVGTQQSTQPLKVAVNDENGLVQMKAKEALKAIAARGGK